MKSLWFKIKYYILSLWVLFLIEVVITLDVSVIDQPMSWIDKLQSNTIAILFAVLVVVDLFIWINLRRSIKGTPYPPMCIKRIDEKNPDYLIFLTTIVMPLIAIEIVGLRSMLVLLILIVVIFLMLVKTDLIFANPTLAVLGFRFYSIAHTSERISSPVSLITKQVLKVNDSIDWLKIDDRFIWGRKNDHDHR